MLKLAILCLCFFLVACSKAEPVKIGFVGSLTGPTADLGSRARNGTILAVEQWNDRGGVNGSTVELTIRDDKNDPLQAVVVAKEMIANQVVGIVGPSTSAMAMVIVPLTSAANMPTFGTTVTTDDLVDIDDYFFRPVASTRSGTQALTQYINQHFDIENYAMVTDLSNEAYTRSWKQDFNEWMNSSNVQMNFELDFLSGDNLTLLDVSQQLALLDTDMIVLVTNARDAALLIKQIRSINTTALIVTCEWAGTTELLRLAGVDAEGILVPRHIDEDSDIPAFIDLKLQFKERFQQDMSFAGLLAYNSTNILLDAIANKTDQQTIKEFLLNKKKFNGVLTDFELNKYGDEISNAFYFITEVRQNKFMTLRD